MTEMQIEQWSTDKLIPYARNARQIPQGAIDKVAASIREFGWQQPIVVDTERVVVAGHVRLLAAKQLGESHVPVHVAARLTPGQIKAFRLMDNRSHQESGWDLDLLGPELLDLKALDVDCQLTGFDPDEITAFLQPDGDDPDGAEDGVPEVQPTVFSAPGDLWLLGKHRLLCGDCRDGASVARLFDGAKANVAITSPPYATRRKYDPGSGFVPIEPDRYSEWFAAVAEHIEAVLARDGSYFLNIKEHAEEGERSLYVKDLVLAHQREWGWRFLDEFCWRKTDNGVPGKWDNRFKNAWEPVFHFCRNRDIKFRPIAAGHESDDVVVYSPDNASAPSGSGLLGCGAEKIPGIAWPSNVIEAKAETTQASHSAPFPRALVEFFLKAFSDTDDVIFDPFLGSGTTLIAAEGLARTGYGIEISPGYCDVIVRRYEALTGCKARLEDGRTLDQLESAAAAAA